MGVWAVNEGAYTDDILRRAVPRGKKHWIDPKTQWPIYLTPAGQIMGAYVAVKAFRSAYPGDYGRITNSGGVSQRPWEAHHIVEEQDLEALRRIGSFIPRYDLCPAVLLPERAHRNRVNRSLGRGRNRLVADLDSYEDAYRIVGDYTGYGEAKILGELMAVCRLVILV
jgi:hypothetical protein